MRADRRGQCSPLGLGPLETAIMQVLWVAAGDWLIIREIRDRMDYPPVAYTTIATVTSILYGKGLLRRDHIERAGHPGPPAWRYRAARPASQYIGGLIATLLDHSPSPAESLTYALSTTRTPLQPDSTAPPARAQEHRHDV